MPGRIVVLVSGSGSNMRSLIAACERAEIPGKVVAVVGDRHCAALETAQERGVDAFMIDPKEFGSRDDWSEALRGAVACYDPDLVVSAGFMRILGPAFVDPFADRLINLHPSLLPAFPGSHAVRDALSAGAKATGTTVHFVDHDVDHGPVIAREEVEILPDDTEASLHDRIKAVEHELLPRVCRLFLQGKVRLADGKVLIDA